MEQIKPTKFAREIQTQSSRSNQRFIILLILYRHHVSMCRSDAGYGQPKDPSTQQHSE